jgi:hypothetical protein
MPQLYHLQAPQYYHHHLLTKKRIKLEVIKLRAQVKSIATDMQKADTKTDKKEIYMKNLGTLTDERHNKSNKLQHTLLTNSNQSHKLQCFLFKPS